MTDSPIDLVLLSSFLDGTATPEERQQVLRLVASSREAYSAFIEASAIRDTLHADASAAAFPEHVVFDAHVWSPALPAIPSIPVNGGDSAVVQDPGAKAVNRLPFIAPAVVLAAAAMLAVWVSRERRVEVVPDMLAVVQTTRVAGATGSGSLARALGAEWEVSGWTVTRGAETALSQSASAFRVGVRFANLQLVVSAHDSAAVASTVAHFQRALASVEGSAQISSMLGGLRQAPPERVQAALQELPARLSDVTGAGAWFELGLWIAVARAAVANGDATFFASDSRQMRSLNNLLERSGEPAPAWRAATAPLRTLPPLSANQPDVMRLRALALQRSLAAAAE